MTFIYQNRPFIVDEDENALLDVNDFTTLYTNDSSEQFESMVKSGKRKHSLTTSCDQSLTTNSTDIDDDSGFCGSNLLPNVKKMVRFDEELLLLKALMKEVNEPLIENTNRNNTNKMVNNSYQSKSKNGKFELKILSQPEEQHRARYLTEGSRGAIKDRSGLSHPIVKLCGYSKGPVKVQCFIGHDKQIGSSHLFYQASKITGKNSTRCTTRKVDGTTVIVMDASPENDMQLTVDCVGILKERNVDVEQKLTRFKNRADSEGMTIPTKKRSTRCRLVFRCQIPDTNEILQVVSSPILCTQPLGTPEVCKKSLSQCDAKGGQELFIIGKNFLKDAKIIWKNSNWTKVVEPDKEFLHSTHLICVIPSYDGPDLKDRNAFEVSLTIKSGGKYSDPHKFTFINFEKVNALTLINGTSLNGTTTSSQLLVSNFEKPIVLTMIGSSALTNSIDSQQMVNEIINKNVLQSNITPIQTNTFSALTTDSLCYTNTDSNHECVLSVMDEETNQMDSNLFNTSTIQNSSQLNQTFDPISELSFEKRLQDSQQNTVNNNEIEFKSESLILNSNTSDIMPEPESQPESQYLALNSFNTIPSNDSMLIENSIDPKVSSSMTDIPTIPLNCDPICNLLEQIPPTQLIPNSMTVMSSEPSLTLVDSMSNSDDLKTEVSVESIPIKTIICGQNQVMTTTATTNTPLTQASNISALSEMSDAELLCFINPAAFDQM